MAAQTLSRGATISATGSPATTIYTNLSGADKILCTVTLMNVTDTYCHGKVYIHTSNSVGVGQLENVADVPPRSSVTFPITNFPNGYVVSVITETASALVANLDEVNP